MNADPRQNRTFGAGLEGTVQAARDGGGTAVRGRSDALCDDLPRLIEKLT